MLSNHVRGMRVIRDCPECAKLDAQRTIKKGVPKARHKRLRYLDGNLSLEKYATAYIKCYAMECEDKRYRHQFVLEQYIPEDITLGITERMTQDFAKLRQGKKSKPRVGKMDPVVGEYSLNASRMVGRQMLQRYHRMHLDTSKEKV